MTVVDFHAHFRPPGVAAPAPAAWVPPERRAKAERFAEVLASFPRIVEASQAAGVDVRVLSLPAATLLREDWDEGTGGDARGQIAAVNDYLAGGVRDFPDALRGLATIDAFAGDEAAAEARRAVEELGLSGIVVDSGKAGHWLGEPQTLPVLQEAAHLGVPVLVHPVQTAINPSLAQHAGALGNSYGRGLSNGIALLGLIHRGVLDDIPGLRIVFTTLGLGALAIAGAWRSRGGLAAADSSWRVHFDTMGLDPENVAYLVSVLGTDRVVLGTDFPHHVDADPETLRAALDGAGLGAEDRLKVTSTNASRLLTRGG